MRDLLPASHPLLVLVLAGLATAAGALGATRLEPEVDFLDTVPADEPGLDAYRALLAGLDGVRFVVVHMPADPAGLGAGDLRSDAGFDALVRDQQRLTDHVPGRHRKDDEVREERAETRAGHVSAADSSRSRRRTAPSAVSLASRSW